MSNTNIFEINNLKKYFYLKKDSVIKAVDNISFEIKKGETLGLVGESGCGKTTTGRTMLNLHPTTSGEVLFKGKDVHKMSPKEKLEFRKKAQIIFQDPYSSLNPRMTVGEIVAEGIKIHFKMSEKEREIRVAENLDKVGLSDEHITRFPHELSGGQRQRVGIARALAVDPEFIMCDEPISALDVSIQAQIVNLLIKLQRELDLTYLFISHDLSMVKHISDKVGVMYLGSIVELTTNDKIYKNPIHPYTQALISSILIPDPKVEVTRKRIKLPGEVPSAINPLPGCKFRQRCSYAIDKCAEEEPPLIEVEKDHFVACYMV